MWKNPRLLTGLLLTALAAAVVLLGLYLVGTPAVSSQRLPDGTLLTLAEVSYGREHRFVHGNRLQKLLYSLLPPRVWDRVGCPVYSYPPMQQDRLVFWTVGDRSGAAGGVSLGTALRLVAADEHGCEGQDAEGDAPLNFTMPAGQVPTTVNGWQLPIFPRRGDTLRLRAYQWAGAGVSRVAEFSVGNPTPGPHPVWRAEPLPVTKRAGSLEVTLRRLVCGVQGEAPHGAAPLGSRGWTVASFQLRENGKRTEDWRVEEVKLSDATGNLFIAEEHSDEHGGFVYVPESPPGEQVRAFLDALWPDEPWKLRVKLVQLAGFGSRDVARVSAVTIPRNRWTPPAQDAHRFTTRVRGTTLRVVAVQYSPRSFIPPRPLPSQIIVTVRVSGLPPGEQVSLASPPAGAAQYVPSGGSGAKNGDQEIYLEVPPGVRKVDLALAVHRSRVVDFIAQPRRR